MATAGARAGDGWPTRRTLLAVLVVSVVLNLFFIAGAAWTRINGPPQFRAGEPRSHRMASELSLNPQQQAGLERYLAATRARSEKMQAQFGPLLGTAWDAAAKPQINTTEVLQLFDEAFDKRRELQREAVVQMLDFMSTLSPDQRAKFVAWVLSRRGPWRSPSGSEH